MHVEILIPRGAKWCLNVLIAGLLFFLAAFLAGFCEGFIKEISKAEMEPTTKGVMYLIIMVAALILTIVKRHDFFLHRKK